MLLDIAFGLFASYAIAIFFEFDSTVWQISFGVVFALLPDLDFLLLYLRKREIGMHAGNMVDHRDGMHYPLVYIPIGTAFVAVFGAEWAALFFVCSLFHFVHDSIGTGWGVKWLWPFTENNHKLFSEKDGTFSKRVIVSWNPEEMRRTVAAHGDADWIRNLFMRPLLRGKVTFLLLLEIHLPIAIILYMALRHVW